MNERNNKQQQNKQPGEVYQNVHRPLGKMLFYNFLGGISWGLGTIIGVGLILALIGFIISKIDLIPILGDWIADLTGYVLNTPTYKSIGQ